ncbi:MAG: hypothetical protein LUD50_02425, partial [Clostridia bacterium]|nr:hypothetical protein [Clostridia bacterium]
LYDNLFYSKEAIDRTGNFNNGTVFMDVVSRPVAYTYSLTMREDGQPYIDFLPFPAEDIGAGCSGYGILNVHADETQEVDGVTKTVKDLCWDFIKFVISEEGQETTGAVGFTQPILKSLEENGAWRTAISANLNHSAWVAGNELRLNSFDIFDASVRTTLRGYVSNFMSNLEDQTEGAADKRDELIEKYAGATAFAKDMVLIQISQFVEYTRISRGFIWILFTRINRFELELDLSLDGQPAV